MGKLRFPTLDVSKNLLQKVVDKLEMSKSECVSALAMQTCGFYVPQHSAQFHHNTITIRSMSIANSLCLARSIISKGPFTSVVHVCNPMHHSYTAATTYSCQYKYIQSVPKVPLLSRISRSFSIRKWNTDCSELLKFWTLSIVWYSRN
jgi:hypothetical protein